MNSKVFIHRTGYVSILLSLLISGIALATEITPDSTRTYLSYNPAILLIRGWQLFSKNSGGFINCQFRPSCSEFGIESIQKKGTVRGILSSADRISRCHPFASKYYIRDSGGKLFDPVSSEPYYQSRTIPVVSISLSFFVPGFNKMINGRFYDGLTTLVLTDTAFYCMFDSYDRNTVLRIPFTFVFCAFYISDVYFNFLTFRGED